MIIVLLIEDNHDVRENTRELLELEDYSVITAHNGKAGLSLAKENIPDIILCDVLMPEASGFQVIDGLKKDTATAHIPFIFLTASVEKKEVEKAFEMGADGYIRKPFEAEELFETMKRCLNS